MSATIKEDQISVVVQGPISHSRNGINLTRRCLESIRRLLPTAELILSTWEGSDVTDLPFDTIVLSADPGGLTRPNHRDSNVNRQIHSTRAGLLQAKRQYALKIRSDCELYHTGFIDLHSQHPRCSRYNIFSEPITASSIYFKNPHKTPFLFHIGDIFHFGLTEDLLKLWDIPLAPAHYISEWSQYFKPPLVSFTGGSFFRYIEEQYIWIACLNKHGINVDINYPWQMSESLIQISEQSIFCNFNIADNNELGLCIPWDILFFGLNKIYNIETREILLSLYRESDEKKIKKRAMQIYFTQKVRTPLKYIADLLNRYGVF